MVSPNDLTGDVALVVGAAPGGLGERAAQALAEAGTISPEDLDLISFVDTAEEALAIIDAWPDPELDPGPEA